MPSAEAIPPSTIYIGVEQLCIMMCKVILTYNVQFTGIINLVNVDLLCLLKFVIAPLLLK